MNADFWMDVAIGSLGAWAFLIVILVAVAIASAEPCAAKPNAGALPISYSRDKEPTRTSR
jgi:hypothetical protein